MNVEYTGRGATVGIKERKLVETELARVREILGERRAVSAHVILTEDKYRKIVEVTLNATSETLVTTCEGTDMLQVLHDALRKIEQQAVKHKERRLTVERHAKPASQAPLVEVVAAPNPAV